jgi:hypothetical protein
MNLIFDTMYPLRHATRQAAGAKTNGRYTSCDPFGIPSTSHWTGAVIIVQGPRTKSCIVTGPRASRRPMPSSMAG